MVVHEVIIHYITNHLDPTNYVLNFSIIALHEIRPKDNYKVYIKEYQD